MRFLLFPFLLLCTIGFAQDYVLEAEDGVLTGSNYVRTDLPGYTGTGAVGQFSTNGDRLDFNVDITKSGVYHLEIRYMSTYKEQDLYVNDVFVSKVVFEEVTTFSTASQGEIFLEAGQNKISIVKNWGWMTIDNLQLTEVIRAPHDYSTVDVFTVDPNISSNASAVYDFLRSNYGEKVLSGQIGSFDKLASITTKTPLIKGWDFQHYTNGYAYLWDNTSGGHTFGWHDPGVTEEIIDWYNSSQGCGLVSIQWHWHAPNGIGSSPGTNSFRSTATTFDISEAINPSHHHYQYLIEDIDSIATQLKKLEDAGVPVLWRPLHEAGGEWFWWGAKGAGVCEQLWDLVYDRIVNHHDIHNLIWVWSTPEEDWYIGNDKCDILGYDSYPGANNYTAQSVVFHDLYEITNGQKILALTENGPLPDIDLMKDQDAMWSFFATWVDFIVDENSEQHVQDTYAHQDVLTLENTSCSLVTSASVFIKEDEGLSVYPNPTQGILYFEGVQVYQIFDVTGNVLLKGEAEKADLSHLSAGIYLLRVGAQNVRVIKQ